LLVAKTSLFTLLISLIFVICVPVTSVLALEQNKIALGLSADRSDIWIGDVIQMTLRISNLDGKRELIVNDVLILLPDAWKKDNPSIEFDPSVPVTVLSNSSELIQFSIKIPDSAASGSDFTINGKIHAVRIDTAGKPIDYFDTFSMELTTQTAPPQVLRQVDWNAVWILFLVYAVPGAAIERIVELLKWIRLPIFDLVKKDAEITAYKDEIKRQEARKTDDVKPEVIIGKKHSTNIDLSATGKAIRDLQLEISRREIRIKAYTYFVSFLIALGIAAPLVLTFELGLLQLLLRQEGPNVQVADILITAIIMSFITKPTHDVISLIEKIKNARVPAK
jgi:hypothetical protein